MAKYQESLSQWKLCKNSSYTLYNDIGEFVVSNETVTVAHLKAWQSILREINCALSVYQRSVDASEARLRLEMELLKQGMTTDILDREATYTQTLELIRTFEIKNGDVCSNKDAKFAEQAVIKSLNIIGMINQTMSGITDTSSAICIGAAEASEAVAQSSKQ